MPVCAIICMMCLHAPCSLTIHTQTHTQTLNKLIVSNIGQSVSPIAWPPQSKYLQSYDIKISWASWALYTPAWEYKGDEKFPSLLSHTTGGPQKYRHPTVHFEKITPPLLSIYRKLHCAKVGQWGNALFSTAECACTAFPPRFLHLYFQYDVYQFGSLFGWRSLNKICCLW